MGHLGGIEPRNARAQVFHDGVHPGRIARQPLHLREVAQVNIAVGVQVRACTSESARTAQATDEPVGVVRIGVAIAVEIQRSATDANGGHGHREILVGFQMPSPSCDAGTCPPLCRLAPTFVGYGANARYTVAGT
jgi:hypothetical protein